MPRTDDVVEDATRALRRAVRTARTKAALDHVDALLAHLTAHSVLVTLAVRALRSSRLYRWVTSPAGGEPTVVDVGDSRLGVPLVRAAVAVAGAVRLAWAHALVAPLCRELRWQIRYRPARVVGGLLALVVCVEYGRFFYPGVDSALGSLGRGALIGLALLLLRLRLPSGTVSRSRTVGLLRAILLAPDRREN